MFSCRNCLASALRAVALDAPASVSAAQSTTRRWRAVQGVAATTRSRSIARAQVRANGSLATAATGNDDGSRDLVVQPGREGKGDGNGNGNGNGNGKGSGNGNGASTGKEVQQFKPSHMNKELQFLGDPLKFAENTKLLLRRGEETKALKLVQMAGRSMSVTVSWNHLINYCMGHGKVNQAWSYFQEMKKRGQRPDAHTFTIMLKGFAENIQYSASLGRAITIYQSMFAPNSPVTPGLIHTNAVLQVCGLAKDLDSMFEIAAKLPNAGRNAADHVTFTTILHTIRVVASDLTLRFGAEESLEEREQRYRKAVNDGKRIWEDVIARWADGHLLVDEELVCAMARLLLLSGTEDNRARNPQDVDDILSLLEQAMGIPRQIPKLKWHTRTALPGWGDENVETVSTPDSAAMMQLDEGSFDKDAASDATEGSFTREDVVSVFDPVQWKNSQPRAYARPGNNSLSVALTACGSLDEFIAASKYWDLMSQVVRPDQENCHAYLRVLRLQRASRHSLALVKQMRLPRENGGLAVGLAPKTFRLAMAACARDSRNPNALGSAMELIEIMEQTSTIPDLKTMESFSRLLKSRGRRYDAQSALGALELLHGVMLNLRGAWRYGSFGKKSFGEQTVSTDGKKAKPTQGRMSVNQKAMVVDLAKLVEETTVRVLDFHKEDISLKTQREWYGKVASIRKISHPNTVVGPALVAKERKVDNVERKRERRMEQTELPTSTASQEQGMSNV